MITSISQALVVANEPHQEAEINQVIDIEDHLEETEICDVMQVDGIKRTRPRPFMIAGFSSNVTFREYYNIPFHL